MRIVFDTNVYISGFINPLGTPNKLLQLAFDGQLKGFITQHIWSELKVVLSRPKIRKILDKNPSNVWVDLVKDFPEIFLTFVPEFPPNKNWIPEDQADNWIIQCAITAKADYIISGDQDILALGKHVENILILSPTQFWALWKERHPSD